MRKPALLVFLGFQAAVLLMALAVAAMHLLLAPPQKTVMPLEIREDPTRPSPAGAARADMVALTGIEPVFEP